VPVFIARQPIFDRQERVISYELLYRSGRVAEYDGKHGSVATAQVIVNALMAIGLDQLTGGRRGIIRFTRELLLGDLASLLPADRVVVNVQRDVPPEPKIFAACERLKSMGFMLAVDECVLTDAEWLPLLAMADLVRVDFANGHEDELCRWPNKPLPQTARLMATKVESDEEFKLAVQWGYHCFQGYFFSKPCLVEGQDVPGFKTTYLRVLQQANQASLDVRQLAEIIKPDLSVTYKLLKYINSPAFSWRHKIENVNQAIVALGEREFRKWVSLICLTSMGEDRPRELLVDSVVRAYYCEAVARRLNQPAADYFMLGLLSHLEAIIGQPLPLLLKNLPTARDVQRALLQSDGPMAQVLQSLIGYQTMDPRRMEGFARRLGLPLQTIAESYLEAVAAADQVFATEAASGPC